MPFRICCTNDHEITEDAIVVCLRCKAHGWLPEFGRFVIRELQTYFLHFPECVPELSLIGIGPVGEPSQIQLRQNPWTERIAAAILLTERLRVVVEAE